MKSPSGQIRRKSTARSASGVIICPACTGPLKQDSKWCPSCGFTGSRTLDMFPGDAPPLLPILDAVGLLDDRGVRKIESARDSLAKRFPQFRWKVCIIDPSETTSLPVFGFWLLNACPLLEDETVENRAWTVLLLIHSGSGQAAIIPGYAAEPFLSDDEWKSLASCMVEPWAAGDPSRAIATFFMKTRERLDLAWKRYGAKRKG